MYQGKRRPNSRFQIDLPSENNADTQAILGLLLSGNIAEETRVRKLLSAHYGKDILQLVLVVFDDQYQYTPDRDLVGQLYQAILDYSIEHIDQFARYGETQIWLFHLAIKIILGRYRKEVWKNRISGFRVIHKPIQRVNREPLLPHNLIPASQFLDHLSSRERLVCMLHLHFDMHFEQISAILDVSTKQIKKIYQRVIQQKWSSQNPGDDQDPSERLNEVLASRYLSRSYIYGIEDNVLLVNGENLAKLPNAKLNIWNNLRGSLALIAFSLLIIAGIIHLGSLESNVNKPVPVPDLYALPTPIPSTAIHTVVARTSVDTFNSARFPTLLYSSEPGLSSDGRFLAFSSSLSSLVPGDTNGVSDVFVYDRETNSFERVSISTTGDQGNGISMFPSISGDGRWITFASLATNLTPNNLPSCPKWGGCADIFLHDRRTGTTIRVNQNINGEASDGQSTAPSISADGTTIAYWSSAENLISDDRQLCGKESDPYNCFDIFIHRRKNGQTERIPVGRQGISTSLEPIAPVSLSEDGQLVAFTLVRNDRIADQEPIFNQSDVVVYDLQAHDFIQVNRTQSGAHGDHSSYSPHLSALGKYIAFVTYANNLVPEDRNRFADVFVRDLTANTTQLISANRQGVSGNAESGTHSMPGVTGWGEQLDISADGRFIVFISEADDIGDRTSMRCGHPGKTVCRTVYLHDRLEKYSMTILPGHGRDSYYLHVSISGDGRWISVVEQYFQCPIFDLCTELWLFDRENVELINPIRNLLSIEGQQPYNWSDLSLNHGSSVNALAFSPDGTILASGANDGTIRLWNPNDGSLLNIMDAHRMPVSDLAFSADSRQLISASHDGTIYTWRLPEGTLSTRLLRINAAILSLDISTDGNRLAAAGLGAMWQWEIQEDQYQLIENLHFPGEILNDVTYSPDNSLLAVASSDGTIWLRNTTSGKMLARLGSHEDKVLSISFSPDGKWLASGSSDNTLVLWRLGKGTVDPQQIEPVYTLIHSNWVQQVAFYPDGNAMVSTSLDNVLHLWAIPHLSEISPGLQIRLDEIISVTISPDGQTVVAGTIGGYIHYWKRSQDLLPP